jgi:hypothetical protein
VLAGAITALVLSPSPAVAADNFGTKARLHVLTMECVLESINNGITDISSIKPSDCEKEVGSSPPLPVPDSQGRPVTISPSPDLAPQQQNFQQADSIYDVQLNAGQFGTLPEPNLFVKGVTTLFQALVASVLVAPLFLLVSRLFAAIFLRR